METAKGNCLSSAYLPLTRRRSDRRRGFHRKLPARAAALARPARRRDARHAAAAEQWAMLRASRCVGRGAGPAVRKGVCGGFHRKPWPAQGWASAVSDGNRVRPLRG